MSYSLACCGGTAYSKERVRGFLRNVITYPWNYTVLHHRRTQFWYTAPREPKILVIFMFPLFFSHLMTVSPSRLTDNCGCISSCVLNFDTRLSWVVGCTLRSLYHKRKPLYSLGRRLTLLVWTGSGDKYPCPYQEWNSGRPSTSQSLCWLSYLDSCIKALWCRIKVLEIKFFFCCGDLVQFSKRIPRSCNNRVYLI